MSGYRRLTVGIGALLIAYWVAAIAVKVGVRRDREIFPLFAWSLFSKVESEPTEYAVRLAEIGADGAPAARWLDESLETFRSVRSPAELWMLTQRLGDALAAGDGRAVERWRRLLEANHLAGHGAVRYEVVERHFVTSERASTGTIRSTRTLASFTAHG